VFLLAFVTLAMLKSAGELADEAKETIPMRLPVPACTSCTNSEMASRATSIFVRPVPSSSDMLPERSTTIITSRVMAGGGAGATSVRNVALGK
jgi:hypothetical protein